MIETFIIGYLMGIVTGLISHEKIFPENKTVNEITNDFKIKRSSVSTLDVTSTTPEPEQPKRKGFLRRIFKRKDNGNR